MPRPALSLAVVGADHPNPKGPTRRFGISLCRPGDSIELRREPKNPSDENAVAVFDSRGIQIGYLTAERAPWISGMIVNGREICAVFQEATSWGALIRVAFDGAEPLLPEARIRSDIDQSEFVDSDPEWQPDEDWPET